MTRETTFGWEEEIPALKIEKLADGSLMLTVEDTMGNGDDCVLVHPLHLRFMAEKMGLVREMSASEADALRMVDKLARRLRLLHGRVEQLQKWLADAPDMENADIIAEYWFNDATLDLATEFIREIDESAAFVTPRSASANGEQKPNGSSKANSTETHSVAGKACANPSGKASAKALVKASELGDGSLFGSEHV